MSLRLSHSASLVILALICALAVSGVASALPAQSSSVSPRPGRYKGSIGVFTLSFTVSANRGEITKLQSNYNPGATCSVPTSFSTERFGTLKIHDDQFSGSMVQGSGTPTTFSIEGRFTSATHVTGKISGRFTIKSLGTCSNHSPFSAHRVA